MTPEERIYIDQKFTKLHEEIHDIAIDVAEIKQWKKDQDEFDEESESKSLSRRELIIGAVGSLGVVFGIIAMFM